MAANQVTSNLTWKNPIPQVIHSPEGPNYGSRQKVVEEFFADMGGMQQTALVLAKKIGDKHGYSVDRVLYLVAYHLCYKLEMMANDIQKIATVVGYQMRDYQIWPHANCTLAMLEI